MLTDRYNVSACVDGLTSRIASAVPLADARDAAAANLGLIDLDARYR